MRRTIGAFKAQMKDRSRQWLTFEDDEDSDLLNIFLGDIDCNQILLDKAAAKQMIHILGVWVERLDQLQCRKIQDR